MDRKEAIAKLKRVEAEVKLFRQSLEEGSSVDTEDLIRATATLDFIYRNRHWWGEGMAVVDLEELKANLEASFGPTIKGGE